MRVIECPWELDNLGCRVCEISIDREEVIDVGLLKDTLRKYDYVVCKVSYNSFQQYNTLCLLDMTFNESQISIGKTFSSFDLENRITANFLKKISLKECVSIEELKSIVERIKNVYDTDRIAINPCFGKEIANKRYGNWIATEWTRKSSRLFEVQKGNRSVGFCLFKENGQIVDYLLGGLYAEFKNTGIGLCLPLLPYLYKQYLGDDGAKLNIVETKISTNNLAVLQCYMHYCYQVENVEYIFTKNNNI